ncbi:MAG TPA: alpha/beta hydrolase [Jiangellaceae bacterium]
MPQAITDPRRPTAVADLDDGPVEYRLDQRGDATVVVFHGGHMNAGLALGEDVFIDLGYTVLVPSRPGYGKTPVTSGGTPDGFARAVRHLCERLSIERIAAVVGISAGGPTAVAMAAGYPQVVERLILESAVGTRPWPDLRTRLSANVLFNGTTEKVTWAALGGLMRGAPNIGLRLLLRDLSTKPVGGVIAAFTDQDRAAILALLSYMRSGQGFLNDLRNGPARTLEIGQPTLIVASRHDRSVPFAQAEALATGIPHAELVVSEADTHFIWFGTDYHMITDRIGRFLSNGQGN